MVKLPKIDISLRQKKSFFDKTHDVNTTMSFGFCEPTLVDDLIPGSSVTLNTRQFLRLAPLPCPTFGRMKLKTYNTLVPIKSVNLAWENFQSQTSTYGTSSNYVPQNVDYVQSHSLFKLISLINRTCIPPTIHEKINVNNLFFTISLSGNVSIDQLGYNKEINTFIPNSPLEYEAILHNFLGNISRVNDLFSSTFTTKIRDSVLLFNPDDLERVKTNDHLSDDCYLFFRDHVSPIDFNIFKNGKSLDNADYILEFTPSSYYHVDPVSQNVVKETGFSDNVKFYLGIHLTPAGKRLFKILNACHINFKYQEKKPLYPLFAYYKAWFDLFNPGRNTNWYDTSCYWLIHRFYDTARTFESCIQIFDESIDQSVHQISFIRELANLFYSLDVDNITAAQQKPVLNTPSLTGANISVYDTDSEDPHPLGVTSLTPYGSATSANSLLTKALLRSYSIVGRNSIIGNRIAEYFKAHNLGLVERQTDFIGSSEGDVNISDIMSTVNNEQTVLGEYAAKGTGVNNGTVKFEVKEYSILIQFTVLVPYGGYCQGDQYSPIFLNDFYHAEYDSLGFEPVRRSQIVNKSPIVNLWTESETFGFLPRYFSSKVKNNLSNGGFHFRSEQASFLPYSLDRFFSQDDINPITLNRYQSNLIEGVTIEPDEALRYIGKYESYGNYDRVFYDTTGNSDNFILHCIQDYSLRAPMLPVSESFGTIDREFGDSEISIQKS